MSKENEITLETVNKEVKATTLKNDKTGKVIGDYVEVNQRVLAFRKLYPNGSILTDMVNNENGVCVFKARIFNENDVLLATGYAYEKEDSTFINKTSYIENCETSAVGRALGFLGIGIDTSIASKEEVINAVVNQDKPEKKVIYATPKQVEILNGCTDEEKQKIYDMYNVKDVSELAIDIASKLVARKLEKGE